MNLFYLDDNHTKCAEYHVDKHIVKMPLEAAQLLCTTLWIDKFLGYRPFKLSKEDLKVITKCRTDFKLSRPFPYLPTMPNHPCAVWVRSSLDNYNWTIKYAVALGDEYTYRYGKVHKSVEVVKNLPNPTNIPSIGPTPFSLAMPDILKDEENPISSYRNYYLLDKATFASWKNRPKPEWWDESLASYDKRITAK